MVTGDSGASWMRPAGGIGIAVRSTLAGLEPFSTSKDTAVGNGPGSGRLGGERMGGAWGEDGADMMPRRVPPMPPGCSRRGLSRLTPPQDHCMTRALPSAVSN